MGGKQGGAEDVGGEVGGGRPGGGEVATGVWVRVCDHILMVADDMIGACRGKQDITIRRENPRL